MDPNFELLMIAVGVALVFGLGVSVFLSQRVREHGLLGAIRRALSGGAGRNPYST